MNESPVASEREDEQQDSDHEQAGGFGGVGVLAVPVLDVRFGLVDRNSHDSIVIPPA